MFTSNKNEVKKEVIEHKKSAEKLCAEIRSFKKSHLKNWPVYFANTNPKLRSSIIACHGFLVTGKPGNYPFYDLYLVSDKATLENNKILNNTYIIKNKKVYFKNNKGEIIDLEIKNTESLNKFLLRINEDEIKSTYHHVKIGGRNLQEFRILTNTDKHKRPPCKSSLQGKTYKISTDIMRVPFKLTSGLIHEASEIKFFKNAKPILEKLEGKIFITVEYFIKYLLTEIAKIEKINMSDDDIDQQLHNLNDSFKELIALNAKYNEKGSRVPLASDTKESERDLELFQKGHTIHKKLGINVTVLQEILSEQMLYTRFLDEKIGIGKSLSEKEKQKIINKLKQDQILSVVEKHVKHNLFPRGKYQANCNSSTATLVETCINRMKKLPSDTYQKIETGSCLSYGSNSRMHLHDPLLNQSKSFKKP